MAHSPRLTDLVLSRSATDRSAHLRKDPEWIAESLIDPSTRFLCVHNSQAPFDGENLVVFKFADIPQNSSTYFLGRDAGIVFFGVSADADFVSAHDPDSWLNLRGSGALLNDRDAGLLVAAIALDNWNSTHTHCPRCGGKTVHSDAGWARRCTTDNSIHFPRTDPVVIMLITHGNNVLVGRSHAWPEGMYSLLAGFVEPGETLEAAVRREVLEESGILVGAVSYLASQPWPFPASLMFGCSGTAMNKDITIDPKEIEDALWVSREDMLDVFEGVHPKIKLARKGAIAHFLLENWLSDCLE